MKLLDIIKNFFVGASIAILCTVLVIVVYDSFVDDSVSISTREWHCTEYEHVKTSFRGRMTTEHHCIQWTKEVK